MTNLPRPPRLATLLQAATDLVQPEFQGGGLGGVSDESGESCENQVNLRIKSGESGVEQVKNQVNIRGQLGSQEKWN